MKIISYKTELNKFNPQGDTILIPIYNNYTEHPKHNQMILLYILQLSDKQEWMIITKHHNESLSDIDNIYLNDYNGNKYTIDKKNLLYSIDNLSNLLCLSTLYFLRFNKQLKLNWKNSPLYKFYSSKYKTFKNINSIIPIYKHYESCSNLSNGLLKIIDFCDINNKEFKYFNFNTIPEFKRIEETGIQIDKSKLLSSFGMKITSIPKDNRLYSHYSFNTITGRPSNTYQKINFAALNKSDNTREAIISRFNNGLLLEYDYVAYHLRLIANIIGFKIPKKFDFHKYMAQQYYNTKNVTSLQISTGKQTTFKLLYGGVTNEYKHIPFYTQLEPTINLLWNQYCKNKKSILPTTDRIVKDIENKYKLFNYFIQNIETKRNTSILKTINTYLIDKKTKIILYTYDSFLFDYCLDDGKEVLKKITNIITDNGDYNIRFKAGINYKDMKNFVISF